MKITKSTKKGQKKYQQDRILVHTDSLGILLAVMDGHGGEETAEFIRENLAKIFMSEIQKEKPEKAFRNTTQILHSLTKENESGSTLAAVWVPKNRYIGHACILGDSSVVVKNGRNGKIWISPDHNVRDNPKESSACKEKGGTIMDGYVWNNDGRGIQLSRALGDSYMGEILNKEPEIFTIPLTKGTVIILASDGVFDPQHADTENQAKRLISSKLDASGIVNDAIKRKTFDNVSAIVCSI